MAKGMIVLGLTGGIGMGKTTVASQLAAEGASICNADAIVHDLLAKGGGAVKQVGTAFPDIVKEGAVDRKALGAIVFSNEAQLKKLEDILHPIVVAKENAFIEEERKKGTKIAVLEIPILYETGAESRCDAVLVVTAPASVQKKRVMQRSGMTEEKFAAILAKQMPDKEKRRRADFIVQTGFGKTYSRWQVKCIVAKLKKRLKK